MRHYFSITVFILSALFLLLPARVRAGSIRGTVSAQGLPSPANILVYLANGPGPAVDLSKARFVLDQRNLTFIPHILPVLVGSTVEFPNNDSVKHNVFSLSRTKKFNLGSYAAGTSKSVLFDKSGIVEVHCDVHAEMSAYILVLKSPYWAVTDADGRFEIPDVSSLKQAGLAAADIPAGSYAVKTWHEKLKTLKENVVVPANGPAEVQLKLARGVPGVLYK